MARLAAGDRTQLDGVYRRLDAPVRAFCARLLGAGADAEDAAQEALVTLFGQTSTFDPRRDALSWAFTIAAWECRTARRRRGRSRVDAGVDAGDGADGTLDPEARLVESELRDALATALESLGETDRRVLEQVLEGLGGDATFRKRKERMLDRVRAFVRRAYDLDV